MKRAIFAYLIWLAVTPTSAQPILINEFVHEGFAFRAGATPSTVPFRFNAAEGSPQPFRPFFDWMGNYGLSDVGKAFDAPPDIVEGASDSIRSSYVGYFSTLAEISFQSFPPVNRLGHKVTAVTRIIDKLEINGFQNIQYTVRGTQRIQFWGEPIPPLPGDYNQDGEVDAADYVVWRERTVNYDPMPNGSGSEFFEGIAVPGDYAYWRANFGRSTVDGLIAATVPEPVVWTIVCALTRILIPRRGR